MNRIALILMVTAFVAGTASAQTVYRCGSEYTRVPCADGRLLDVSDTVTAERTAEAREAARREQRLGDQMASDRRAEAAAYRPARAGNLGPVKPPVVVVAAKKKSKAKRRPGETVDGDFIARVPKTKASAG